MEGLQKDAQLAYIQQTLVGMERMGIVERTGEIRNGRDVWRPTPLAEYLIEHEPLVFEALIRSDRPCLH